MADVLRAPGVLGSHLDAKFRQALAKRVSAARYTLFNENQAASTGAIAEEDLITKSYSEPLFNIIGDTLHLDIYGRFANNANNKQVHIRVTDESGGLFINFDSQVFAGSQVYFNLRASLVLSYIKALDIYASMVSDLAANFSYSISNPSLVPYSAKKCNIIIEATGGAANDVILFWTRGEFSPGFLG